MQTSNKILMRIDVYDIKDISDLFSGNVLYQQLPGNDWV